MGISAQTQRKESFNWVFGLSAGMTWNTTQTINGMSGLPTPLPVTGIFQWAGSFCMSDANGNLLFYSDGVDVWNKNHAVMQNGSGLAGDYDATQSGIAIPYPGQANKYIVFTIGIKNSDKLAYSVIDMTLAGGLGGVVSGQKNIPLTGHVSKLGENVTTVKKTAGAGYWLVAVGKGANSSINVWDVTTAGVQTSCYASYSLPENITVSSSESYLRFSTDGKHFAYPTFMGKQIFFGEFNPATGTFPTIKVMKPYECYGLDFNLSGDLLYAMETPFHKIVHCYKFADLLASSNPGSMDHYKMTITGVSSDMYPLQLGPDGRLYSTIDNTSDMIVIDNINNYGNSTVHVVSGLILPGASVGAGLPNFSADFLAPQQVENVSVCSYFTDDIWYFGSGGGITFKDDLFGNKVAVNSSGESLVNSNENSLSVSSPGCGSSLIFYSQHDMLYNALHQPMMNGSFSGHSSVADGLAACYIGGNKYMVLSVTHAYEENTTMALQYHIIDMNEDNGYGKRISTGTIEASGMSESVELVPVPGTSNEYWLVYNMRQSREIRVRKITGSTVGNVVSTLPMSSYVSDGQSYLFKTSPKYNMLAIAYPYPSRVALFNFDVNNGSISVNKVLSPPVNSAYGVEFSPDGNYLYCASYADGCRVTQYNIANSTFTTPFAYGGQYGGGLKLGPDGKLYVKRDQSRYVGVIANPNAPLTSAGYTQNGFDLGAVFNGLTFSTGLTPPSVCPVGLNQAPVATDDVVTVFLQGNTICAPVMQNDYDPNPGDVLSLVNVFFVNESDSNKVKISFSPGGADICITPKAGAREGDVIYLTYSIRDNASPIHLCSDANISVFIKTEKYPDNVSDADCFVNPPATVWGIGEITPISSEEISGYGPLMAGDIDGDGKVEILAYNNTYSGAYASPYPNTGIKMFWYNNGKIELKRSFLFKNQSGTTINTSAIGSMAIARYNNKGYIVIMNQDDKYLYCYNETGAFVWKSSEAVTSDTPRATILNITDFNADSIPEVYTSNKIFSLATGNLLCSGGNNNTGALPLIHGYSTVAADMDNDGLLELVAGTQIYKVVIPAGSTAVNSGTMTVNLELPASEIPANALKNGATQVVDIDNDGLLEVVVTSLSSGRVVCYVWKPQSGNRSYRMGSYLAPSTGITNYSIPTIGNIDNDTRPEILFITTDLQMYALKTDLTKPKGSQITLKWTLTHTDQSGCTGMTLFDFNQDGVNEIVYRDETRLRIINGNGASPAVLNTFDNVTSGTIREFPVIADVDNDGQAEIVVAGHTIANPYQTGFLRVFKSNGSAWASARKVWNQYAYNAVNVNEDLTIPRVQFHPATLFPGADGLLGTSDDVRPYNNFMQQQTALSKNGTPIWLTPNAVPSRPISNLTANGNAITITLGIINNGDAAFGAPIYVTLYKNAALPANRIATGSENTRILPGDTGYITVTIPDITAHFPLTNIVIRINDDGVTFPYQTECNTNDSEIVFLNPFINRMMKKQATLNNVQQNGTYPNPVSVLYNENIKYDISAVNANLSSGSTMYITDTLPPYLNYCSGSATGGVSQSFTQGTPQQTVLQWKITGLASMVSQTVSYEATPESGVSASQPLFINCAWVRVSDTIFVQTNSTYHQGAGVAVIVFSASSGGSLLNAGQQALDYLTSPRAGILAVPEEGYEFAGWSHDEYMSLRGETIKADSGIMNYGDIVIYGNVELHANFVPATDKTNETGPVKEKVVDNSDKVWANGNNLYIHTTENVIVRIYTIEGTLHRQLTITKDGTTNFHLKRGVYIVTLNNGAGHKVVVE
jgi:hypothetical protein